MKYVTLELTEEQANTVWQCLGWAYVEEANDPEFAKEDKVRNAYIRRLRNKVAKAIYGDRASLDSKQTYHN